MRLLATGEFEAVAEQETAAIQRAEGEREAAIKVAEGRAEAIKLVNESAEKYFVGNAQALKQIEMVETSLKDNAKVILNDKGITPTLLLGELPVNENKR
jgi:regulator of protease activity HflC (stomatin/prohibitin superfamily)